MASSGEAGMTMIQIVVMVCRLGQPDLCEEQHLQFAWRGSLQQCAMTAQLYIAQWIGEHPQWTVKNYRCEYPGASDRADAGGAASRI
jgi:hypothetical protein